MDDNINLSLVNAFRKAVHLTESSFFLFKGQGRILSLLSRHGGELSQREALRITEMKSSSLSEITAKLEAAGYISKEEDEADRRSTRLRLTQSGRERAGYIRQESAKLGKKAFAVLSAEDKQEFLRLLSALNRYWSETL